MVSDAYIRSNRSLFDIKSEPFSNCTRTVLVDSILNNLEISYEHNNQKSIKKGLPLLITDNIFEESFVLHDQTSHSIFLKVIDDFKRENKGYSPTSIEYLENIVKQFSLTHHEDTRAFLQDQWGSMKNLFKFQPLSIIKNYFGEKNALYFGFVGSFISMLWLPAIVGTLFFILGISIYYE